MRAKFDTKTWLKQILPQEHGSWSFVLEPLFIAAILDWPNSAISSIGIFLMFLGYRPAMLAAKDFWRKKRYPRTWPSAAVGIGLLLSGTGLCLLAKATWLISATAIVGAMFVVLDLRASPRSLWRELAGALLAVPAAIIAAPFAAVIFILRVLVAVLSIRGVLARMPDHEICRWVAVGLGIILGVFSVLLFRSSLILMGIYWVAGARAIYLAFSSEWPRKPVRIGITEGILALSIVIAWFTVIP